MPKAEQIRNEQNLGKMWEKNRQKKPLKIRECSYISYAVGRAPYHFPSFLFLAKMELNGKGELKR